MQLYEKAEHRNHAVNSRDMALTVSRSGSLHRPPLMRFWTISMLVVFATTSYIDCQQASQSNKVSYEGQKVATVELVANPKIPVESLRSLVQQKIDEPYSASRIEDSRRGTHPLIKLDCAAIPLGLLESELFGHERGGHASAVQAGLLV
jgi:hypothetical protein